MKQCFLATIIFVFFSCNDTKQPKNLLDKNKMSDLITELSIYNSICNYYFNKDTIFVTGTQAEIFAKYGIDSLAFQEQHNYYKSKTDDYSEIIEKVKEKISAQLKIAEKEIEKNPTLNKEFFLETPVENIEGEKGDVLTEIIDSKGKKNFLN